MPLMTTGQPNFEVDNDRSAIGFWMTVEDAVPVRPIRVFVTYEALAQIEPSQPRDVFAAMNIFEQNRALIEGTASEKFDRLGVGDERYDGQPILGSIWTT